MINKVGCPIDLYYAPAKLDLDSTVDCEAYSDHMGSLDSFISSGLTDLDLFESPVIYQRTYNSHSFVARTSHDNSLVARVEIEADIVHDCPVKKSNVAKVEVTTEGAILQQHNAKVANNSSNITEDVYKSYTTHDLFLKRNPADSDMATYTNLTFRARS